MSEIDLVVSANGGAWLVQMNLNVIVKVDVIGWAMSRGNEMAVIKRLINSKQKESGKSLKFLNRFYRHYQFQLQSKQSIL